MDIALSTTIENYSLLFFQPDPEGGERVCIGILAGAGKAMELLYDPNFPKLRCIAPRVDVGVLHVYMEELLEQAQKKPAELESVLLKFTPQLISSEKRKIRWPLTEKTRALLIDRFLRTSPEMAHSESSLSVPEAKEQREEILRNHIRGFVEQVSRGAGLDIVQGAGTKDIIGRKIQNVRPIAIAIKKQKETILIDGVDLRIISPASAVNRVAKVVHTFWQYGNIERENLDFNVPIRRVGVVLNGMANPSVPYKDAHDFALNQFDKESDLSVDASSESDKSKLDALLRG
jgi:hypothetical protein